MGIARLLAKGWVMFCLFAGAYALDNAAMHGMSVLHIVPLVLLSVFLFGAMGLLFIGGYGISGGGSIPLRERLKPHHTLPGFNESVFIVFVFASFAVQTAYVPDHVSGGILRALQAAIEFAVPGQRGLEEVLGLCRLDGGRMFASAFAWLLALIYLGSALSRIRLTAGIVRLERKQRPETLGPVGLAVVLGLAAVIGIQLLYMGSLFSLLPCETVRGIPGQMLTGMAPLMLAYLVVASLANLVALGPEA